MTIIAKFTPHLAATTVILASILCLTGLFPGVASALPYQLSEDGAEVIDQGSGLTWRRCTEGMRWDGATCAGDPIDYTRKEALQKATAEATATGKGWRLPTAKELASIVDGTKPPAVVDATIFPATPTGWFWSVPAKADYTNYAWYLDFFRSSFNLGYDWYVHYLNDSVFGYNHGLSRYVRLARDRH